MKERPILFSGEMVRAILAGRKTQTRRVLSVQPFDGNVEINSDGNAFFRGSAPDYGCRNPYGVAGGRLWVKETHLPKSSGTIYRADFDSIEAAGLGGMYGGWKPSIFMPRKASRITLEIVAVRVERLQDIIEADALAEGVTTAAWSAVESYFTLWETINGQGSWAKNPWVWVIVFKRA